MAAADADLGYLSAHLGLAEPTLASLATKPDVDLVKTLLQSILGKAREFDTIYSEKLQVDIELENVHRSSEALREQNKATVEKALKDAEEERQKRQEAGE
jgi:nucleoprotein TPR